MTHHTVSEDQPRNFAAYTGFALILELITFRRLYGQQGASRTLWSEHLPVRTYEALLHLA
jgi:hypothetical protein